MALRKRVHVSEAGVPVELLDENHPKWGGNLLPHREAAAAFALEQGWVVIYSGTRPFPDLNKMRDAGIPTYDCARLAAERHPELSRY